jgi:hypothetical protein
VPCLAGSFDPRDGIYHGVAIMPYPLPGVVAGATVPTISSQSLTVFKALFDTGAHVTCVSQRVALAVGLIPRARRNLVSASEVKETNLFLFSVGFLIGSTPGTPGTLASSVHVFGPLEGLEIHAEDSDDVDVLVGMDILGYGALHVGFNGQFMFSW